MCQCVRRKCRCWLRFERNMYKNFGGSKNMTKIEIKGDADLKVEVFGKVLYHKDSPFDFTVPLNESGAYSHTFGAATITVGVSGDTVSVAASVMGVPIFQQAFSAASYTKPVPFKAHGWGDTVTGTITLSE